jgi:hypothetical protein
MTIQLSESDYQGIIAAADAIKGYVLTLRNDRPHPWSAKSTDRLSDIVFQANNIKRLLENADLLIDPEEVQVANAGGKA